MARLPPRTDIKLETDPSINYYLCTGEKLRQCPYEKSHKILSNKFVLHLQKCRRNYILNQKKSNKPVEIEVCRFSSFHHVKKSELEYHEANCPTRMQEIFESAIDPSPYLGDCIGETSVKREDLEEYDKIKEEELRRQKEEIQKVRESEKKADIKFEREYKNEIFDEKPLNEIVGGSFCSRFFRNPPPPPAPPVDDDDWESVPGRSWEEQTKNQLWGAALPGVKDYTEKFEAAARKKVILNPQGLTKSEKKEYRELLNRVANEKELKPGAKANNVKVKVPQAVPSSCKVETDSEHTGTTATLGTVTAESDPDSSLYSNNPTNQANAMELEFEDEKRPPVMSRSGRFSAIPVGFPGWDLDQGDRRVGRNFRGGM